MQLADVGLYNSYGNLIFFFPKRVRGGVTEINAHDSSRRADMRITSPSEPHSPGRADTAADGKLTAISALPCGTEARVSLAGGMFGPNGDGNVLLLDEDVPVVATSISSPPKLSPSVIVDKDTVCRVVLSG